LNELFVVAFKLAFAVDFKVAFSMAFVVGTRMEETFVPFASVSCALATLAFFAVFKVLIRDFFWMDMWAPALNFVFVSDAISYATGVPIFSASCANLRRPQNQSLTGNHSRRCRTEIGQEVKN
jgi:hypothetical protein